MKKLFLPTFLVIITVLAISCAKHSGYMQSSASLSANNFTYVKTEVQGEATATYIFGIGGLQRQALVNEAKRNLLSNYQLQPNQALVDITVNWKQTFLFFLVKHKCTVTASVVEFNK